MAVGVLPHRILGFMKVCRMFCGVIVFGLRRSGVYPLEGWCGGHIIWLTFCMLSIFFRLLIISITSSLSCTRSSMMPSNIPSSDESVILWMLTFICSDMTFVTSLSIPMRSMPLRCMVASKYSRLCISHLASSIRLPKLDFSFVATGQERLCISTWLLLSINPRMSSPGIG